MHSVFKISHRMINVNNKKIQVIHLYANGVTPVRRQGTQLKIPEN